MAIQKIKRIVKKLGNSNPIEFPAAEISALIVWGVIYSMCYKNLHNIIATVFATLIAITVFVLFKRYIKSDRLKQKAIDIDIINLFNLSKKNSIEVLSSSSNFNANLHEYAIKTLINLQLIKFFAELTEDGKVIVTVKDNEGNIISNQIYYSLISFSNDFMPKENA